MNGVEEPGLVVEPGPVTGHRPQAPAVLAGIVAVAFLGAAIVKPWDRPAGGVGVPPAATPPAATPSAPPPASATPVPTLLPVAVATPFPFAPLPAEVAAVTRERDGWGVRAVVVPAAFRRIHAGGPDLVERWMSIDVTVGAAWNLAMGGTPEVTGDAVLALGATTPVGTVPRSVRFWRLDAAGGPREIAPTAIPGREHGMLLWLPDPDEASPIGTWSSGTYRIDVGLDARVVHLVMVVGREPEG